jgi:phosphotransferase system enzyme I (PtsI)
MQVLHGLGVSGGVAVGRAVCIRTRVGEVIRFPIAEEEVDREVARFEEALRRDRTELARLRHKAGDQLGEELGAIFEAHLLMLQDPAFTGRILERIRGERVNAEWAVQQAVEETGERFASIEDEYLRDREQDLRDVARHLLRTLSGLGHHELSEIGGDVVVVADDLTPSDAVRLGREAVVAFVTETGSRTSHTAIIAHSLNIPMVAGLHGVSELLTDQDPVVVDGDGGVVVLHPTSRVLAEYRRRRRAQERHERAMLATRELAAETRCCHRVDLMANVDLLEEIEDVLRFGAAGIGLYRSEFLYIERSPELPSEDDHLATYRRLAEAAAPYPAIIRTYDLGGRKLAREVMHTEEENPVLGLRGIRLTLARPEVFRTQLRGLFRAACHGDVWVMLPMIATLDEVRRFRRFAGDVMDELEAEGVEFRRDVPVGVMIEVPSAALIADLLAREVDFFSIGTNDLIQYSLAVDRNNEHVADLYQPLHPAILRMLKGVIAAAHAAGIECGLCGEMAGDPRQALLLVGLGLRRLSMSPRLVPEIKTRIRASALPDLERLAEECLGFATAAEVERHLESALGGLVPVAEGTA